MKTFFIYTILLSVLSLTINCEGPVGPTGPSGQSGPDGTNGQDLTTNFISAVYAMSNNINGNTVVAFGRRSDGSLTEIGTTITGGNGAILDAGEGLDPLISSFSLYKIILNDQRFILAVNAGSNSISALRVNQDYSLTLTDMKETLGENPISIAVVNNTIYVAHTNGVISRSVFGDSTFSTFSIESTEINRRLSCIRTSEDASYIVISVLNTGRTGLNNTTESIIMYPLNTDGTFNILGRNAATSTGGPDNNASGLSGYNSIDNPGRNFPTVIGLSIAQTNGKTFALAIEAREIQADGDAPEGIFLQAGSITSYEITDGGITPISVDVITDADTVGVDPGQRTTCWSAFSVDFKYLWTSNSFESSISTFEFDTLTGEVTLLRELEVDNLGIFPSTNPNNPFDQTEGFIDCHVSSDGDYYFQLHGLTGRISVYRIGNGGTLTFLQEIGGLPQRFSQGIISL